MQSIALKIPSIQLAKSLSFTVSQPQLDKERLCRYELHLQLLQGR
jgi:hypothetical protein